MVAIGIHTPETEAEKNVETVKKKMKATGLTHPIAIDNKTTMCKSYWPSVYLFDKQGIARWGWSGELSWKGAKGQAQMREKIEELLRE